MHDRLLRTLRKHYSQNAIKLGAEKRVKRSTQQIDTTHHESLQHSSRHSLAMHANAITQKPTTSLTAGAYASATTHHAAAAMKTFNTFLDAQSTHTLTISTIKAADVTEDLVDKFPLPCR